jgi:hypothetical protein
MLGAFSDLHRENPPSVIFHNYQQIPASWVNYYLYLITAFTQGPIFSPVNYRPFTMITTALPVSYHWFSAIIVKILLHCAQVFQKQQNGLIKGYNIVFAIYKVQICRLLRIWN